MVWSFLRSALCSLLSALCALLSALCALLSALCHINKHHTTRIPNPAPSIQYPASSIQYQDLFLPSNSFNDSCLSLLETQVRQASISKSINASRLASPLAICRPFFIIFKEMAELAAIFSAIWPTSVSSDSKGTALLTRPIRSASFPSMYSPVNRSSLAFPGPIKSCTNLKAPPVMDEVTLASGEPI